MINCHVKHVATCCRLLLHSGCCPKICCRVQQLCFIIGAAAVDSLTSCHRQAAGQTGSRTDRPSLSTSLQLQLGCCCQCPAALLFVLCQALPSALPAYKLLCGTFGSLTKLKMPDKELTPLDRALYQCQPCSLVGQSLDPSGAGWAANARSYCILFSCGVGQLLTMLIMVTSPMNAFRINCKHMYNFWLIVQKYVIINCLSPHTRKNVTSHAKHNCCEGGDEVVK